MNRIEIDKAIREFEPTFKKVDDMFWAYRVLLTAPEIGPIDMQEGIEKFWKVKRGRLKKFCFRAIINGVWYPYKTKYLDAEIYNDRFGLALGANILMGYIKKNKVKSK